MSGIFLFCLLFTYASASISASPLAEFIAIAGGGAGAQDSIIQNNAGGGAGGYVNGTISIPTDGIPIQIIVGAGGRGNYANDDGFNGEDSSFGDIVAKGGGGAGGGNREGRDGGSGGGGGFYGSKAGGEGLDGQGHDGAQGLCVSCVNPTKFCIGGGGGAGSPGGNGDISCSENNYNRSVGGDGILSDITGEHVWRAGGGGSGYRWDGNAIPSGIAPNGRGGGSGSIGGGGAPTKHGGDGCVIVRVSSTVIVINTTGSPNVTDVDGDVVYQFNSVGNASITFAPPPLWIPCPDVSISERIPYGSIAYDKTTGDFSMTDVEVGFFKLIRKIVIHAAKKEPGTPDIPLGKVKLKITPGTSKFPLKSEPLEDAADINYVRVKIIGNRVGGGSKSTNVDGKRAHPYWECVESFI